MGTREPCDGCHSARAAAIAAAEAAIAEAEARIADAERRTGICEAAADILDPLAERLARALARLRTVPQDLGEVYELVYEFVCSGGKLPRYGRWIEGADAVMRSQIRPCDRRAARDPDRPQALISVAGPLLGRDLRRASSGLGLISTRGPSRRPLPSAASAGVAFGS